MKKTLALGEVLLVFAVFNVGKPTGWLLDRTGILGFELEHLGWSYTGALSHFILPLLILWLARRKFKPYGYTLDNWRADLETGLQGYVALLVPWGLGLGAFFLLGIGYNDFAGAGIFAIGYAIAIWLMFAVLNKRQKEVNDKTTRTNLIVVACIVLFPILVAVMRSRLSLLVVSTVVWQLVFSGIGEEFYWRGYMQSRLNEGFGRPWQILGVAFGPGLIIASILFGLSHVLNGFNPFWGQYEFYWGWGIMTTFSGLFFGLVREKSGSILAPGLAHGLPDAVGEALNIVLDIGYS